MQWPGSFDADLPSRKMTLNKSTSVEKFNTAAGWWTI
jgi:hypothetical protein